MRDAHGEPLAQTILATLHLSRLSTNSAPSKRPIAEDGAAAHHALVVRLVKRSGAMQRAAIVPHHAFARAPMVRIDPPRRRNHRIDLLDQRAAGVVI